MILWEKHVLNDVQCGEFDLIFCETGSKKSRRMIVWCLTPPPPGFTSYISFLRHVVELCNKRTFVTSRFHVLRHFVIFFQILSACAL